MDWLPDFCSSRKGYCRFIALLSEENVDLQRGSGVFRKSIEGLQLLNSLGYGQPGSDLRLDLVFNPNGASLPPDQATLQSAYQQELLKRYDIVFNQLLTITNLPVKRFAKFLDKRGQLEDYFQLLEQNFNPRAAQQVMCKSLISVSWDGKLYDCDFNQMLGLSSGRAPPTIWEIDKLENLVGAHCVADHCYANAGAGSSCGAIAT